MSTILKIKRSSTNPTATPSSLGQGELAYGEGTSTYTDAQSATVTSFGKLFVGRGTETNGAAAGIDIIGGKYFTDLLDHGHGTLSANSAAIVDSAKKVDEWNVDNITLNGNTISTTDTNGDLIVNTDGSGDLIFTGATTLGTNNFKITDGSTDRFSVDSFSGAVDITTPSLSTADTVINVGTTWNNSGATFYGIDLNVVNTNSAPASRLINLSVGSVDKFNVDVGGNVYLTGGISFANATSFNIQDDTTDAFVITESTNKYVDIDTTDGSELITLGTGNVDIDNDLNVDGGNITTNETTFNLLNTNATTVNFAGAATTLVIGNSSGNFNVDSTGNTDLGGDLNVDGDDITTSQTTFNLLNTTATTVNAFGAATAIDIGAATGTTSINNNVDVDGNLNVDGGGISTNQSSFNILNSNATTVNAFGAATTLNIGTSSTTVDFGDLRIIGSTISSDNSNAQTITIDPFPSGGDAGGDVVIRGNLQVSGTTTTVNSTQMTINDPVFTLGDSISEKTVKSAASSGATTITLDNVDGLNVGDVVSGNAAIASGTKISNINTGTKVITVDTAITAGIAASADDAVVTLTFTQGADDNKDRGIEFKYYNSGLKQGFFGYDESGTTEGLETTYYFTYIPDATNTSQVFSGTVGKAYFDTVKLEVGVHKGVAYFDQYKRLTRTVAAGTSDITTSHKILTSNGATGEPIWTSTIDGGTY